MILRPCRPAISSKARRARAISSFARSRTPVISFSTARWRARISDSLAPRLSSSASSRSSSDEAALGLEVAGALDLADLGGELGLEVGQVRVAALLVHVGDEVGGEVDDLLELLGLQLLTGLGAHEQVGEPRPRAAQVPDVHDRGGELDVAHPLAAHLGAGDLDAAALADDAAEADALVLAAVALPVLGRPEDLLAEQAVLLRAQASGS